MKLLSGQVAVVTGAASGIGFALAHAFVRRGLSVVLADVDQPSLDRAEAALRDAGGAVLAIRCDVTDPSDTARLAAATADRFGPCDILCSNAGVAPPPALLWEQPVAAWRWTFEVGVIGAVNILSAFMPAMVARDGGHIVVTSSLAGLVPLPLVAPYCATKYALVGLTDCLADELATRAPGVGVSLLCPGMVESGLAATSARTAPPALSASSAPPADLVAVLVERSGETLSADAVAAMVLDAIEAGRSRIYTHGDLHRRLRERIFGDPSG